MHLGLVSDKLDLYAQDAYSDISTRNLKKQQQNNPIPRKWMTFTDNTIHIHLQKIFRSKCILEKQVKYSQDSIKNGFGEECPK